MLKCKCNFANFFKHKSNGLCSFALLLPLLDILPFILLFSSGNSAFNETESTLWTWHFLFSWHKLLNFYYLMHFSSFLLPVAPHHQPRPSRFLMGFFPKLLSLFPAIWRLMTLSIWKSKLLMLFSWKKNIQLIPFSTNELWNIFRSCRFIHRHDISQKILTEIFSWYKYR